MNIRLFILLTVLISVQASGQSGRIEGRRKINGTDLYLDINGKGEYLLVVHGGPGLNHSYFQPHLDDLEKDFRIVYFDQRACGQSAIPPEDSISIKLMIDDIEGIRKELGIEKLNILSHSWGAVLAAWYGITYPGHVKKIIFCDPAMFSREYDAEASALMRQKSTRQDSVDRAQLIAKGDLDVADYEKLFLLAFQLSAYDRSNISALHLNLPQNFKAANEALFTSLSRDPYMRANLYDSLHSFRFPVLIVQGGSDVIPMAAIRRLKQEIPQARMEIMDHSGHFPFLEEPERFRKTVTRFLK